MTESNFEVLDLSPECSGDSDVLCSHVKDLKGHGKHALGLGVGGFLQNVDCRVWLPVEEVWTFSCTGILGGKELPIGLYCVAGMDILGKAPQDCA